MAAYHQRCCSTIGYYKLQMNELKRLSRGNQREALVRGVGKQPMNDRIRLFLQAGLIAAAAFVAMLILTNLPFLFLLELKGLDFLFLLRGRLPPPPEIVIIAIDEPSFAEISKQWPWPRSIHAHLVEQLKKAGAKVIGFDILFTERSQPEEDRALERAMQEAKNVVLLSQQVIVDDPLFRYTIRVDPIEPFKEVAALGLSTLQIYPDGTVRRAHLGFPDIPSFALQVARLYMVDQTSRHTKAQLLGGKKGERIDPSKEILINYLGPPRTVKTVSYYQALAYDQMLPPGIFAGKIALVGRSNQAATEPQRTAPDVFHTPFLLGAEGLTSGVEIQATIISNILTGRFVAELTPMARLGLLMILALVASLMLLKIGPIGSLAVTLGLSGLFLGSAAVLFASSDLWLPIFAGMLQLGLVYGAHLVDQLVTTIKIKERIKDTFETYIDPRIVEGILLRPDSIKTSGEKRVVTVFFSDMEKFSSISEQMTPAGLVNLINQYLTLSSESIRHYNGIIDKYIGDAIMAFWSPPFTSENEHAKLACFAALEQLSIVHEFRRMLPDLTGFRKGLPIINIRVGLATGEVIIGNIGSNISRNYTVMGDTVNIASRLESASKQYGTQLLISEQTQAMARDAIETRELDAILMLGKSEPVRIFELLARKGELDQANADLKESFERGLNTYRNRDWDRAQAYFAVCLAIDPADGPSKLFIERLRYLRDHPPGDCWDGVWSLTEK
jgi:adenylate cyclase